MKLQHLTVIFVIIMVPITFIMSMYMRVQISTIREQSTYDTKLMDATYDAIKAFQLNTVNNRYSSVSNSKIRDIEAGISTFYNSLGTSLQMSGDTLRQYTPAVINTLYDGYYIYSRYSNSENSNEYEYGLQPYIYYSCRYVKGNTDCIINYTLDNALTIYGTVNGEYVTKTGFLINPENIRQSDRQKIDNNIVLNSIEYKGLNIEKEDLKETIILLERNQNGNTIPTKKTYSYTFYNNRKVYYDHENINYFWYSNNVKTIVNDRNTQDYARRTIGQNRSAIEYYTEAYKFSKWVRTNLGQITAQDAKDKNGNSIQFETNNTGSEQIFNFSDVNDPEKSTSTFDAHRRAVIKNTIETSLSAAIANYNLNTNEGYEYALPKLSEVDWDKICTEICFTTFLQGLPIGAKYYNNYCVIANNQNKEFISGSSIIILTREDGKNTYHRPNCKHLIDNIDNIEIKGAYTKLQLARQPVKMSDDNIVYFFPQQESDISPYLYCYDCIVNVANVYDLDELRAGEINLLNEYGEATGGKIQADRLKKVRETYYRAIGREKYNLYATEMK